MGIPEDREIEVEEILQVVISWVFPNIQLTDFTFTFLFHALEKEMATHSSVLAWRIPGTAEPSGLPSMGSHRVGHDWHDLAAGILYSNISKPKIKTKSLKKQDEDRHFTYKRTRIRIIVDLSSKTMQSRRWGEIFKDWKKKMSILYPEKLSFKSERKIKTF